MTLTQQFIIVSILPASFILLMLYNLRVGLRRKRLLTRWLLVLLTGGIWASATLSVYGGTTIPLEIQVTWRIVGNYALSLLPLWLLILTTSYLRYDSSTTRFITGFSALLWIAALALDPAIWPYRLSSLNVAGQVIRHFDLWGALWITSWLLPSGIGWLLTQQATRRTQGPIYRNQTTYWLLAITLFLVGGGMGLARQFTWHQTGALLTSVAGFVGTVSLTGRHLPRLQQVFRQLISRLLGAAIIFGLIWFSLWYLTQTGAISATSLGIIFPAALMAAFFLIGAFLINRLTQRLFLSGIDRRSQLDVHAELAGSLSSPQELAGHVLKLIQLHLNTGDAWFMVSEDGPQGKLLLRPLTSLQSTLPRTAIFSDDSPFISYLRQQGETLMQYDIDSLELFAKMSAEDREILQDWQQVAYIPLLAGRRLKGLIGVGNKATEETYENQELELMNSLSKPLGLLLQQTENIAALRRVQDHVYRQHQNLLYNNRYLQEQITLYHDFVNLLSPELRGPFADVEEAIQAIQPVLIDQKQDAKFELLENSVNQIKSNINRLIGASSQLMKQGGFHFDIVQMEEVAQETVRSLAAMAEARRVEVEISLIGNLQPVFGDRDKLAEAVRHLLHNAVKFNKIGGQVRIECYIESNELCLSVVDNGVGIPEERMEGIWDGFESLAKNSGKISGLGMGLPLTRFIVQAHGGRVSATSKHGAGSTFGIHLPITLQR